MTATMTEPQTAPEVLTRPNGKTYRPRGPLRIEEYVDHEERTCVVIVGTHDLERATGLAAERWEEWYDDGSLPAGQRRWMRLVPFDTGTGYDHNWVIDEVRGSACVVFDHSARDDVDRAERAAVLAARAVMP